MPPAVFGWAVICAALIRCGTGDRKSQTGAVLDTDASDDIDGIFGHHLWTDDEVADLNPKKDETAEDGTAYTHGGCPLARTALLKLGLPEDSVPEDPTKWPRNIVKWMEGDAGMLKCQVRGIVLKESPGGGQLSPELGTLVDMKYLRLPASKEFTGDVGVLENMTQLEYLVMSGTAVMGDVGQLRNLKAMKALRLSNTGVHGDLNFLQHARPLFVADLSWTAVRGTGHSLRWTMRLQELYLRATQVGGDIADFFENSYMAYLELEKLDLGMTKVYGTVNWGWQRGMTKLRVLSLSDTNTTFSLKGVKANTADDLKSLTKEAGPMPKLREMDVSGCPLNMRNDEFFRILRRATHLSRLRAAWCNLTGKVRLFNGWDLGESLMSLDLSHNQIDELEELPGPSLVQLSLAGNGKLLKVPSRVLAEILERAIYFDMRESRLTDDGMCQLLGAGVLKRSEERAMVNTSSGYYCHGVTEVSLQMSPALFCPELLCACLPGWSGYGIHCKPCEMGSYNELSNRSSCRSCPRHSVTEHRGSSRLSDCICKFGRIAPDESSCQCWDGSALQVDSNTCLKCADFNLACDGMGHTLATAQPKTGFALFRGEDKRVFRCFEPAEERCNASSANRGHDWLGCALGYEGPLCSSCQAGFRSSGPRCKKCRATDQLRFATSRGGPAVGFFMLGIGAMVAAAWVLWRRRQATVEVPDAAPALEQTGVLEVLRSLLLAQMSVLMQFVQLWGVLGALSTERTVGEAKQGSESSSPFWEQEYVQWLQLTAGGLQDALNLECSFGETARFMSALGSPLVPLALLLLCALLEVFARSEGVSLALKVLTFLFIGGASSCANLMSCHYFDGGERALGRDSFKMLIPQLKCEDSRWQGILADGIGFATGIFYAVVIPGFLVYLLRKQRMALAPSRKSVATAETGSDSSVVRLCALAVPRAGTKEPVDTKHLLAAAVARVTVYFRGTVTLQLQDDGMLIQVFDSNEQLLEIDGSTLFAMALQDKQDADQNRWLKITRMLTERCVFEDAEKEDRVLAGAKTLFCKYALFQDVWLEVALKLVSVALIAVVSSNDGLKLSMGLTLATATVLAVMRPYVQGQVNDLQSACFACLAASALGFAHPFVWLARGALALPFLLALCQAIRPDGPEALAQRLYQEAESQLPQLEQGKQLKLAVLTQHLL